MSRTLPGSTSTEVTATVTDTVILVALGFSSPVYLSTREQITWDAKTWLAADMRVQIGGDTPNLTVYNENTTLGETVLAEGTAGKAVQIYQRYGTETPVLLFDGEMGKATIGDMVSISCRRAPARKAPNIRIAAPVFNYVPKRGLKIVTSKGTVELESR